MECTKGYSITGYSFSVGFKTNMELGDFSMTHNWGKQKDADFRVLVSCDHSPCYIICSEVAHVVFGLCLHHWH